MIQRSQSDQLIEHQSKGVSAGDTLEVGEQDVAIFSRQGQLVRVLQPGSYQVPAEFAGPDMEVFFVTTRQHHDEKFGGQLPAGLPVRTAFGKCSWVIRDPERAALAVGDDAAGLGRFVTRQVQKAVQLHGAKAAMKGAPLDGSLHGPILAAANEKLGPLGLEVIAITELTFR
jgi:hypothetical protein